MELSGNIGPLKIEARFESRVGTLALVGPNGAGKTSLLLMILGVLRPDAGRIVVAGVPLFDSRTGLERAVEERKLGYVPQDYALFPHLNVLENVQFGVKGGSSERRARALSLLREFGLSDLAERRTATLSGGEKQRVALARALASEPRAVLLDEPLAALDAPSRRDVRTFLASHLRRLAIPALIVTHDPADAIVLGERIAVLEAGRIVQTGTWQELRARPASSFVQQFVAER